MMSMLYRMCSKCNRDKMLYIHRNRRWECLWDDCMHIEEDQTCCNEFRDTAFGKNSIYLFENAVFIKLHTNLNKESHSIHKIIKYCPFCGKQIKKSDLIA